MRKSVLDSTSYIIIAYLLGTLVSYLVVAFASISVPNTCRRAYVACMRACEKKNSPKSLETSITLYRTRRHGKLHDRRTRLGSGVIKSE